MPHSKHIKGDRAELIAAEYFISLGYSVARNMSQHGPVDLVLIDEDGTGDVILVDVKLIFVDLDTKEVLDIMPSKRRTKQTNVKKTDLTNVVDIGRYKQWMEKDVR